MREVVDQTGEVKEVHITVDDFISAGLLSPQGLIMLPGHPLYDLTLFQDLPPGWQAQAARDHGDGQVFIHRVGSALMTPATENELQDYLQGGEYDEWLTETDYQSLEDIQNG
ncbi:MAG: hypothetical protein AAFR99_05775 [Cyanobacteria bacterium J06629_9]